MSVDTISPLLSTDDAFKASGLERMLSNFSASYKLYFLRAIFDIAVNGESHASYETLAARMVSYAWYPVLFFRLNLGATDQLAHVVNSAHERLGISRSATDKEVLATLLTTEDSVIKRQLSSLCRYVPYRLLRPFYDKPFAKEKAEKGEVKEGRVDALILRFNAEDPSGAPYTFEYNSRGIIIDSGWTEYFQDNQTIIRGWLDMRLIDYLQRRNPSVPAIPLKIYPPVQRDLTKARSWWTDALADHSLRELYSGIPLERDAFIERGPLSIDHFVPWSFVLHDEPWDLLPTFRCTNSAKGNRLPNLEKHLKGFCSQQFDALLTLRTQRKHRKLVDSYVAIDPHIMEYERSERSLESFSTSLTQVITPLHQIAMNQGFPLWIA